MHGHFAKTHLENLTSDFQKFEQLFPKSNDSNNIHNETVSNQLSNLNLNRGNTGNQGGTEKRDKWENKSTTSNLNQELSKFNQKIDSGVNYPSLVTPQIKSTKTKFLNH